MGLKYSYPQTSTQLALSLKSDHFGIEICIGPPHFSQIIFVKIRPFWDWNREKLIHFCELNIVKIRPFWDWNLLRIISHRIFIAVKIRPFWDWNKKQKVRLDKDENVKIRPFWDWNVFLRWRYSTTILVKIRPFWDWNLIWSICSLIALTLKSDHFGIEICLPWRVWWLSSG